MTLRRRNLRSCIRGNRGSRHAASVPLPARSRAPHGTPVAYGARGFTLIELAAVILLILIMSGLALSKFGALDFWREKSEIRKLLGTWELLAREARQKSESYRLVVDLADNTYYARREVPIDQAQGRNVDYLAGLRNKVGRNTVAERQEKDLLSLNEEYKEQDSRDGESLELVFYKTMFRDPEDLSRLGIPLDFPSLAEPQPLPPGIRFRDVIIGNTKSTEGKVYIRFSANGATDFAVIHLLVHNDVLTAVMNPATGTVKLEEGDKEYEWSLGKK